MWSPMGAWVPFGLFDTIAKAFSKVLNAIFNNTFFQKLAELIGEYGVIVANAIWTVFAAAINLRYFLLLPAVLKIVDFLESCFNIFAGIAPITVDGAATTLQSLIFTKSGVSTVFWSISIIACILLVAFTIVGLLRSAADLEGKRSVGKVMGSAGKACLTFLMVPLVALAAMELASLVLIKTGELIANSTAGTQGTTTVGNYIFASVIQDAANPNVVNEFLSGHRTYDSISSWVSNGFVNILQVHTTVGLFCGALIALFLFMGMLVFIRRLFELVLLFVSAPYFAASMPLDGGQKFKQWRDVFLGKLVSGFGMVLSIKLYLILVPTIMNNNVRFFALSFSDTVCKLIFLAGGAFAAYKSHSLLTQIVNFQAGQADNESSMLVGGMVMGKVSQLSRMAMHGGMKGGHGPKGPGGGGSSGGSASNHSGTAPGKNWSQMGIPPVHTTAAGGASAGTSGGASAGASAASAAASVQTARSTGGNAAAVSGVASRTPSVSGGAEPVAGSSVATVSSSAPAVAVSASSAEAPSIGIPQSAHRPRAATLPLSQPRPTLPTTSGSNAYRA